MKISEFLRLRQKALDYVRDELGAVICWDQNERARAVELLRAAGIVFRLDMLEARAPVVLVYLYRQSEQYSPAFCRDGECYIDGLGTVRENTKTGAAYSVIGLAVEALYCPEAVTYAPFLFMHELAHCIGPDTEKEHDEVFHGFLDQLIDRYNKATGSEIVNDYCT